MPAVLCVVHNCQRKLPPGSAAEIVCAVCHRETRRRLAELPELYRRSESALTRPRPRPGERVSGGLPGGITLDDEVMSARSEAITVLASWAGLVAAEHPRPGARAERAVPDLCAYLLRHLDWLSYHACAADFVPEVADLHRNTAQATDSGRTEPRILGTCRVPGCDSTVRVAFPARPGETPAGCDAGHPAPPRDWLMLSRSGARP